METVVRNRIAQGVAFLSGILAGWYLYRAGFYRGRVEQSRIIRAERARAAFEPLSIMFPDDDLDKDKISETFKNKVRGI